MAQILWTQHARKSFEDAGREARLAFAGKIAGRTITSFHQLTRFEALQLINALKKSLGLAVHNARRGKARGASGRKSAGDAVVNMAGAEDIERIQAALARLGWSQERFTKWLESPSSPLKGHTQIRTQADANRVWWALKRMMQRQGLWKEAC